LKDADPVVQLNSIIYFGSQGTNGTILDRMPQKERKKILSHFLDAMSRPNPDHRVNAIMALQRYTADQHLVVPVLANALQDPDLLVRATAAGALVQLNPTIARATNAVKVVVDIIKKETVHSIAAIDVLGKFTGEPETVVPALIECLQSTNAMNACQAMRTLGKFREFADVILPAMRQTMKRTDSAGRYAQMAVPRWEKELNTNTVARPASN
jgi:hypothetical protein